MSVILAGCVSLPPANADNYLARVELLALLQTLNADLLSHDSATLTLERWCADHRLAEPPRIVARRVRDAPKPLPDDLRALLKVDAGEPVGYRHVQLMCGTHVFSEADNWYVPGRLTPEMNRLLETSETPFGYVVQPLRPYRRTFAVTLLWSPLPPGWEQQRRPKERSRARALVMPKELFEHRAVLYTSDHQPFSEVDERYQGQVLAFVRGR